MFGGCNTNSINDIDDGGSVVYVTCYMSKNTTKDDKKVFWGCKDYDQEIKWENDLDPARAKLSGNDFDQEDHEQDDDTLTGTRALIGVPIIDTGAHNCSATMAAYLTRNQSRFQYSHKFAHMSIWLISVRKIFKISLLVRSGKGGTQFI